MVLTTGVCLTLAVVGLVAALAAALRSRTPATNVAFIVGLCVALWAMLGLGVIGAIALIDGFTP